MWVLYCKMESLTTIL